MQNYRLVIISILVLFSLSACKHETTEEDSNTKNKTIKQIKMLSNYQNEFYKKHKEKIDSQYIRLNERSPELARHIAIGEILANWTVSCESECTLVPRVEISPGHCPDPLSERIKKCGRHTDPNDFDQCMKDALAGGIC